MVKHQTEQATESQEISQRQQLGEEVQHFPIRRRNLKRWFLLVAGSISLLSALLITVFCFFDIREAVDTHGRAIILNRLPLPLTVIFLAILLGVLMLFAARFYTDNGITLYTKGFVLHQAIKEHIWVMEEIERLDTRIIQVKFGGSLIALRTKMILEDQQRRHCLMNNRYAQIGDLMNQLRLMILPILNIKAQQQFKRDKTINFHKNLKADMHGLETKTASIAWDEIEAPVIIKGLFKLNSLSDQKPFFKSKMNQLKNLDLLLHLINNPPDTDN